MTAAAAQQTRSLHTPSLLRKALWLDAMSSGGMAVLLLLFADVLAPLLGLDAALLRGVGVSFVPFVALVGCLAIAVLGWLQPTTLGTGFIVVQALYVGVMAELQFIGLKSEGRAG